MILSTEPLWPLSRIADSVGFGENMQKNPDKPKVKCKNCEGKGLLKKGDKKVKCLRCGGTGFKS
jgi:ssDNA-binding Zn-finger/Zn-ribbon topoisomerase 1